MDYSITWKYIVKRMEEKYGIHPDSTELYAMGDIERCIDSIWDDYFEMLYEQENTTVIKRETYHGGRP